MESPNDAPWSECGNGCGSMVEHPNLLKPAPWCPDCNAAQYRGDLGDDVADAINPAPARNVMGYQSVSNAHDASVYERGRAHGINAERAAIVAWLESRRNIISTGIWFAQAIHHGEHLEADDE